MLEWEKLGYTVCGTARNGELALELIEREKPDIVIADVKMPVIDGLTLARTCRERGALPAFIMLTSFEEFDYIKQAMGAGGGGLLVKLDLTPRTCKPPLPRPPKGKRGRVLAGRIPGTGRPCRECAELSGSVFSCGCDAGLFQDESQPWSSPCSTWRLNLAERRLPCSQLRDLASNTALTRAQQLKLGFPAGGCSNHPAKLTCPCYVTGADAMRCNVLFCLTDAQSQNYPDGAAPAAGTRQPNSIQLFHGTAALGGRTPPPARCWGWRAAAGRTPTCSPCSRWSSPSSSWRSTRATPPPGRCRWWRRCRSIFQFTFGKTDAGRCGGGIHFSPNYLSQLFGKYGDSGFVEYITETRIAAAKEMLEQAI